MGADLTCKCGCETPAEVLGNLCKTQGYLAAIEARLADAGFDLAVTSGYRCPAHNKKVGGAKASIHMSGRALDLTAKGLKGAQIAAHVEALIKEGVIPQGGLFTYKSKQGLCHYDWRGVRKRGELP